jgi:hypothetical protein
MAQARNLVEAFHAPATPLQRQQTRKAAATLLIQRQQYPVDRPMFFGDCTVRMRLTGYAGALVIGSLRPVFHSLSLTAGPDGESLGPPYRV